MSVKTQHAKYRKFAPKWKRARDVLSGQDAIHEAGVNYLPMLKDQTPESYKAMLKRAGFFNASWRTVESYLGMLFRKPPEKDLPTALDSLLEDVSLSGVSLDKFAKEIALEELEIGFYGVLVDHPPAPSVGTPVTVALAEQLGLRPTMQMYKAESIINWKFRTISNKHTLSMVVLEECFTEANPENEFEDKTGTQWRVLDLDENQYYRQRLFRLVDGREEVAGAPVYPLLNGAPLNHIPFYADFEFEEPPLIDLFDKNLDHYRVNADYRHGLHFTGLPTVVVAGYSPPTATPGQPPDKLYIGSESAWVFPDAQANASYLEFTGQGLSELREALKEAKDEMAILGAKLLASEKAGVEAFKTQAMRNSGETSILSAISIETSNRLKEALKTFSAWAGAPKDDLNYELNREFMPVTMDAPTLTAYVGAWQSGAISEAELFDNLQRGDIIASDKTLEEHQAEIDAAPPPMPEPTQQPAKKEPEEDN